MTHRSGEPSTELRQLLRERRADLLAAATREIVDRGREQFGAEAVVGRIGDAASKLPEEVRVSMPDLPWKEIIGFRIVVDHAYAVSGHPQAAYGDPELSPGQGCGRLI